jgi:hypothetical protein
VVLEVESPECVTSNEIAATFAGLFGNPVRMETAPCDTWNVALEKVR